MNDTVDVLKWAKAISDKTEIVKIFWDELVSKLNLDEQSSENDVLCEVCLFGGNTFANLYRGTGVPYDEVAYDVAKSLKKPFEKVSFKKNEIECIEQFVLMKMDIQEEDIQEICDLIKKSSGKTMVEKAAVNAAQKAAIEGVGFALGKQVAKKAVQKAAEEVGKQVAKQLLLRIIAAVNIVLLLWTVVDIAGPAMRKTIPSVTYIALLRQLYKNYHSGLGDDME